MTAFRCEDAVAVVTGAGGGMGAAIAASFAARGTKVVVTDVELAAAENVAATIVKDGGEAIARRADVTSAEAMQALADEVYAIYGKVDLLCNNAGVTMRPFRAFWEASAADFTWMMDVNYYGVINGLRAFLPRMRAQTGRRHIVNTSSMAGISVVPGHGMYTAAKSALDGISDVLRAELAEAGEDIGVTILYPGQVTTRIGTSERLRPAAERSEGRDVVAWQIKGGQAHNEAIGPEQVGEMVVRAVLADRPYCLTHPAPAEHLHRWVEQIVAGYDGPPQRPLRATAFKSNGL